MSLLRRLWLSVLVAMAVVLLGTWGVSIVTARLYLQQQLLAQGADAAVSLALSMSQHGDDPAMAETLVNAMYDSGHFKTVRYTDIMGRTVVERDHGDSGTGIDGAVPQWFVTLVPLEAQPGEALVSNGWQQAGKVTVIANPEYAYAALWRGTLQLGGLLALAGVLWGIGITALVRWLRGPLQDMANQAEAIGNGQFIVVQEPRVIELRSVAHALNRMSGRVQAMFAEQAARIGRLHEETTRDPVCKLPNREYFLGALRSSLHEDADATHGGLMLLRVADLAALNRHLGRKRTDEWLTAVASTLGGILPVDGDSVLARMNGADFGYLRPGGQATDMRELAQKARTALLALQDWPAQADMRSGCDIAFGLWNRGEGAGAVLARLDAALMQAEGAVEGIAEAASPGSSSSTIAGETAWGALLEQALAQQRFQLVFYPVCSMDGTLVHREAMLRMAPPPDAPPGSPLLSAGQFMPAAMRLGRVTDCDLVAVDLAFAGLRTQPEPVAVNLSPRSLVDATFLPRLEQRLQANAALCQWMSFELSERGLEERIDALAALAQVLSRHGCRLGIEHFGRQLAILPRLYELQVHYLKVDGAFVAGIEQHDGHQRLLRAMVEVTRGLDVDVYAEQVGTTDQWDTLATLGVKGVTGPAVTQRFSV